MTWLKILPRNIKRKLLDFIPSPFQFSLLSKQLKLRYDVPEGLTFKFVETREELEGALKLIYQTYLSAGLTKESKEQIRVVGSQIYPTSAIAIAVWNGQVVGTLTHVLDTGIGLPIEQMVDLKYLRSGNRRLAEISCLAIDKRVRGKSNLLFYLTKFVLDYSLRFVNVDMWVISTHPGAKDFYQELLCFKPIDKKIKVCNYVDGATAFAQYLDLNTVPEEMFKKFSKVKESQNLFDFYFCNQIDGAFQFPDRKGVKYFRAWNKLLDLKVIEEFFLKKSSVMESLSENQKKSFFRFYPSAVTKIEGLQLRDPNLKDPKFLARSEDPRFEVSCKAVKMDTSFRKVADVRIYNLSKKGFLISTSQAPKKNQENYFDVGIAPNRVVKIKARLCWYNSTTGFAGYLLEDYENRDWVECVRVLTNESNINANEALAA